MSFFESRPIMNVRGVFFFPAFSRSISLFSGVRREMGAGKTKVDKADIKVMKQGGHEYHLPIAYEDACTQDNK